MSFNLRLIVVSSVVVLAGCATSSGVMQIGKDTYSLTIQADSASSAKQKAISEAAQFCIAKNKTLEVQQTRPSSDAYGWHSYEANFKCAN